jgi:hypothetical protein
MRRNRKNTVQTNCAPGVLSSSEEMTALSRSKYRALLHTLLQEAASGVVAFSGCSGLRLQGPTASRCPIILLPSGPINYPECTHNMASIKTPQFPSIVAPSVSYFLVPTIPTEED